jgi:peptidoglycan/LPS O-acetylase OafA/YrhL
MLGTYRLVLALLVALSHAGVVVFGMNPGVIAVVGFYVVSGYVMTGLLRTAYPRFATIGRFYVDRALRIVPHYLVVAAITFAWFAIAEVRTDYLRISPGFRNVIDNVLVVPLNFYMFNGADRFTLIPPAWSLGAEIQFYLLVPAIVLLGARAPRLIVGTASVAVYVAATFGVIQSDWFGYRLLPGVLFMFVLGSALYDAHRGTNRGLRGMAVMLLVLASVTVLAAVLHRRGVLTLPYDRETLLGLILGVAAVDVLGRCGRRRIDEMLGALSYGIFLNHYLVLWTLFDGRVAGIGQALAFLAISAALAFVLYRSVERPVLSYRYRLRADNALQSRADPALVADGSSIVRTSNG